MAQEGAGAMLDGEIDAHLSGVTRPFLTGSLLAQFGATAETSQAP